MSLVRKIVTSDGSTKSVFGHHKIHFLIDIFDTSKIEFFLRNKKEINHKDEHYLLTIRDPKLDKIRKLNGLYKYL